MQVSVALPTALDSHENIGLAEELGYECAWLYDTPQNSPDVWMVLARAAERTSRIRLGPGVLIPSLRHPMTNAAATAALVAMAPGRVRVAFGTGFSGRRAMGYRAIKWSYMADYIRAYRGLLRGEVVEWEGVKMQMLHPAGHAPPRPIEVPILISALGPMGAEVARELADGLYATSLVPDFAREFSHVAYLAWGTVLNDEEDPAADRIRRAAGPGTALAWHSAYEFGGQDAVAGLAGGQAWNEVVNRTPKELRHLVVHAGHCVELNEADLAAWGAGGSSLVGSSTLTGTPKQVRAKLDDLAAAGVTEIVYQPCGPDVRRELETFLETAGGSAATSTG
jgi:5,10-methylenetetrahydromethanopterin reductase